MNSWIALADALIGVAQPDAPPVGHADEVVVRGRKPIVVVANVCPAPDPVRYRADRSPRVVDSYPAGGGVVAPGVIRVRVSFDAPMSCFSEVTTDGGERDPCQPDGTWELPARRSFFLQCRLDPSTAYLIRFRRSEGRGFVGLSGRSAEPYDLAFTTTGGPAVASLAQAAALDPGPPGSTGVSAYVTCLDAPIVQGHRDCQRTALQHPPGG